MYLTRLQALKQSLPRSVAVVVSRRALSSETDASKTSAITTSDAFSDITTHTGQKFEKGDHRLSRFIGNKKKTVNTRFAIDLIAEIPPTPVTGRTVSCNGGGGPLGHPKVFINLDGPGNHACGYCGLRFFQDHAASHDH